MKAFSVLFLASLAAAAVTDSGINAAHDEVARDLDAITESAHIFERDEEDAELQPFSLAGGAEDDEEDGLATRDLEEAGHFSELIARQANNTAGTLLSVLLGYFQDSC